MAKQVRRDPIYIAPGILGWRSDDGPKAFDEKTLGFLDLANIDDKITIYERQVKEWFLNRATKLIRGENNGFVVLMICLSYYEGVELYRRGIVEGRNLSGPMFRASVDRIYNGRYYENQLADLYSAARCGLFHAGMVKAPIIISREFHQPIEFIGGHTIKINHRMLLQDIKADFRQYIHDLRTNDVLKQNFNLCFTNI